MPRRKSPGIFELWWSGFARAACESVGGGDRTSILRGVRPIILSHYDTGDLVAVRRRLDAIETRLAALPPPLHTHDTYLATMNDQRLPGRALANWYAWRIKDVTIRGVQLGPVLARLCTRGNLYITSTRFHPHCNDPCGADRKPTRTAFCIGDTAGPQLHKLLAYGQLAAARKLCERQIRSYTRETSFRPLEFDYCPACRSMRELNEPTVGVVAVVCAKCGAEHCTACCSGQCAICSRPCPRCDRSRYADPVCICEVAYQRLWMEELEKLIVRPMAELQERYIARMLDYLRCSTSSDDNYYMRDRLGAMLTIKGVFPYVDFVALHTKCLLLLASPVPAS